MNASSSARSARVEVRPRLLRWAIHRAGLDRAAVEKRFPKLGDWERGERQPTLRQLEQFAGVTRVAVGFLFLSEPPDERMPIPDFRTVADRPVRDPSGDLLDTVYQCRERQHWYREYAILTGEPECPVVGMLGREDDLVEAAARLREALDFDLDARSDCPTWTEALRRFRDRCEASGILVMVSGIVGSNSRRRLDPEEFRGFALADSLAPLIFVNGADAKAAQMFTLAHELAHIALDRTGLSDSSLRDEPDSGNASERWCNRFAAEFLAPLSDLRRAYDPREDLDRALSRLARSFKVSRLVILRRLRDAGLLTATKYRDRWLQELDRLRSTRGGGGDFYATLGSRVGRRFARAAVVSALEGRTTFTEAFRLLGIRRSATFGTLAKALGIAT